jgi:bifunctional non-homologous end joining protein LigD
MARPIKTSLMVPNFSKFSPIIPVRRPDIFDSSDWVYEIKYDGFRALAYLDEGCCRFVSRKGNEMKRFADLCSAIGKALKVKSAVLDGEIVALDESGMPAFYHLMRRKCHAVYYAFDLLWLEGKDLRDLPLVDRKKILRSILPQKSSWIGYVNFIDHARKETFRVGKSVGPGRVSGETERWKIQSRGQVVQGSKSGILAESWSAGIFPKQLIQ